VSELAEACLQSPHQQWQVKIGFKEEAKNAMARIRRLKFNNSDTLDARRSRWLPYTRYLVLSSRSDASRMDVDRHAINMTVAYL
jgi:hypothetical protein